MAIQQVPGVKGVHDLHIWTISSGRAACSCHILVNEQSAREGQAVQRAVAEIMEHEFRITHTIIQVEVEQRGGGNDLHCAMPPAHQHDPGNAQSRHPH
jgi:cobalt-zinc-cadmium efflux system protein